MDGLDKDLPGLLVRLAMERRILRSSLVPREDVLDGDLPAPLATLATVRRTLRPFPTSRQEVGNASFGRQNAVELCSDRDSDMLGKDMNIHDLYVRGRPSWLACYVETELMEGGHRGWTSKGSRGCELCLPSGIILWNEPLR